MAAMDETTRMKRTQSVNRADEIKRHEEFLRKIQPDKPCHVFRDSLLSWSSEFTNFAGFVNWGFILLIMGGFRLLLENLIKYGIRIDPTQWLSVVIGADNQQNLSLFLLMYGIVPICVCLIVEYGLAKKILSEKFGLSAHLVNLALTILMPMVVITVSEQVSLFSATLACFTYCVMFLKLLSYIHVNSWCRKALHRNKRESLRHSVSCDLSDKKGMSNDSSEESDYDVTLQTVAYPNNLNFGDIMYFMFIPTLCYELNFPRTSRIRKRFLLKRIFELVIGTQVIAALIQQWMIPSVKNALIPFTNMDVMKVTERLLKLSIPNHLLWLISFYLLFHSLFNFTGELLHFADRYFYSDWWNANNSSVFWRKWNTVVHRWAVRHVFIPLIEMGYSKTFASLTVFFISAFFHEFLVSVPLRTFKCWAFMGMMLQIPLANASMWVEKQYGSRWGNIVVWLSLILGQPLCIMMYYHDYIMCHYGEALLEQFANL